MIISNESLVTNSLLKSSCLTVFGVSGSGKSGMLRRLSEKGIEKGTKSKFIYVDFNSLFSMDESSLAIQLSIEILNTLLKEKVISKDQYNDYNLKLGANIHLQLLLNVLNLLINLLVEKSNYYLILDHFEKVLTANCSINYNLFKYIRDIHNGKLQYIFVIGDLNLIPMLNRKRYQSLADLLNHKQIFLNVNAGDFVSEEYPKFNNLIKNGFKEREILNFTGGYRAFIKPLDSYGQLYMVLPFLPELKKACERLLLCLTMEQVELITKIVNKENVVVESADIKTLLSTGIIKLESDGTFSVFSPILDEYLKQYRDLSQDTGKSLLKELTKNENAIYTLLLNNKGEIVTKEEIANAIWKGSNYNKYSEWAIDQTVTRLRAKLKKIDPQIVIETKRGRGLILR